MLQKCLTTTHNQEVLRTIKEIVREAEDSFSDMLQYMDEKNIVDEIMQDFHFYEESDTVSLFLRKHSAEGIHGLFSNILHVSASSKDSYIKSLIEDVNYSYDRIKKFDYKES